MRTMTEPKMTPGPWTMNDRLYPEVTASDGHLVADMQNAYRGGEECRANARAIAALPDLIAALVAMTCGTCGYRIGGPGIAEMHGGSCSNCGRARAALAKAGVS